MDPRIHLYIDGQMNEQEKKAFEKELLENEQLHDDYKKMLNLLELAREQYQPAHAPSDITDKIIEAITSKQRTLLWREISVAVAAIILLVLTGTGIFLHERKKSNLINVTFRVSLPDAKKVYLMGNFNNWGEKKEELKKTGNGLFTLTIKLKPGVYQYVYQIDDNRIIPDPNAKLYTQDGFGQKNAILIVKGTKNS